ncbi:MAG: hypothetical protein Q7U53_02025 [Anaerolineaceae bacterium]|nr:hypothetical protein [Anaerolineaceae bacterium]
MQSHLERKTIIFVVRVWQEYLRNQDSAVRGEVENVTSQKKHYFSTIQELQKIIQNDVHQDSHQEQL